MGLFNFIGGDSPMFIPTNPQERGFDIDYDKLAPGLPKKQEMPSLPQFDTSKLNWTTGQTRWAEQNMAEAQNKLKLAIAQSGGNLNAIQYNPNFKEAQQMSAINPFEAQIYEQDKKNLTTINENLKDKKDAIDNRASILAGQLVKVGDTANMFDNTTRQEKENKDPLLNHVNDFVNYSGTVGTEDDLNKQFKDIFDLANGKTDTMSDEQVKLHDNYSSSIAKVRTTETINKAQLNAAVENLTVSLGDKSKYALQSEFLKHVSTAGVGIIDPDDDKTIVISAHGDQPAKTPRDLFNEYVQDRLNKVAESRSETKLESKDIAHVSNNWLEDLLHLHELKKGEKEDASGPYLGAAMGIEKPTATNKEYTIFKKDDKGNTVAEQVRGDFNVYGGNQHSGVYEKPQDINTKGSTAYIGNTKISTDQLKGLKTTGYSTVEQRPNENYTDGKTKDQFDFVIHHPVLITEKELAGLEDKVKVNVSKEGGTDVEQVPLYVHHKLYPNETTVAGQNSLSPAYDKEGDPIPDTYTLDVAVVVDPENPQQMASYDEGAKLKAIGDAQALAQSEEERQKINTAFQQSVIK